MHRSRLVALGVVLVAAAASAAETKPKRPRVKRTPATEKAEKPGRAAPADATVWGTPIARTVEHLETVETPEPTIGQVSPPRSPVTRASAEFSGYADTDNVTVLQPTVTLGAADETAGWSVNGRYLVDAVSAASVDVVSSASSRWFEYRHAGSVGIELQGEKAGLSLSGNVSREPDYLSLGGGGSVSVELLEKNLTPFVGGSYTHDQVGRTGAPKARWGTLQRLALQGGANFILGRSTIGGFTVDGVFERGYLAKPYRFVPLFAPGGGAAVAPGASPQEVNEARLAQRPADALPDRRDRFAVSGRISHRLAASTLRLDQRLYSDSWGLRASTTDARYLVDVGSRLMLWPHLRLHAQNGVDFWQRAYEASAAPDGTLGVPRFRTGDRELGPLVTVTVGAGLRWRLSGQGSSPMTLFVQADGSFTRYHDALYIQQRHALFTAIGLEVELD